MGRTTTPTYRVEFGTTLSAEGGALTRVQLTPHAWRGMRPRADLLAIYVEAIADRNNLNIASAHIVRQSTGQVVATYRAPLFRVVQEA